MRVLLPSHELVIAFIAHKSMKIIGTEILGCQRMKYIFQGVAELDLNVERNVIFALYPPKAGIMRNVTIRRDSKGQFRSPTDFRGKSGGFEDCLNEKILTMSSKTRWRRQYAHLVTRSSKLSRGLMCRRRSHCAIWGLITVKLSLVPQSHVLLSCGFLSDAFWRYPGKSRQGSTSTRGSGVGVRGGGGEGEKPLGRPGGRSSKNKTIV